MELIKQVLQQSTEYEFRDGTTVEIPIMVSGELDRYEEYTLDTCGRTDEVSKPIGNSYGAHGEEAGKHIPNDHEWYARAEQSETRIADVLLYGYFDDDEVLVRNETSMVHRTANYYWVSEEVIKQ
jgi:hypothetical protein